jgi:Family of unknown function (DUF6105)
LPVGFLAAWYTLSYNDISFGILFFSRQMHDMVFQIYGEVLGIDPALIPPLLLKAMVVDTLLILGLIAFRRRKQIIGWWQSRQGVSGPQLRLQDRITAISETGQARPAE